MNRDRVEAQLRNLDRLIDDYPLALLSLVLLEDGTGLRFKHPRLLAAENGSLEEAEAAMRLIRAQLLAVVAHLDASIDEVIRASTRPAQSAQGGS
jgi:hypothetical protein